MRIEGTQLVTPDVLTYFLNKLAQSLGMIDPTFNEYIGQAEPPSEYLTDGRLAYADGTNWNPNAEGKGLYRYDATAETPAWVKIG